MSHISPPISDLSNDVLLVISVIASRLYLAPFPRYYHIYSVHDCLQSSEVLRFQKDG